MRRMLVGLALTGLAGQACIVLTDFDFHEVATSSPGQGGQAGACGATVCGSDCVSLESDPAHCGACDHDCQGGECIDGRCQPVLLHEGAAGEIYKHLDVHAGVVYWSVAGPEVLRSVHADGTNFRSQLAPPFSNPPDFVRATEDRVFVTSFEGGWVAMVQIAAARLATLEMEPSGVVGVDVEDDVVVYHRHAESGAVRRKAVNGPPALDIAANQFKGFGIRIDAGEIYWSTIGDLGPNPGTIATATEPSALTVLAPSEKKPSGIDLDATHVYWIDGNARIRRVTRQAPHVIEELFPGDPLGEKGFSQLVRVDDTHVYATIRPEHNPSESGVLRVDKETHDATFVVRDPGIGGLADDDTTIYYTTPSNPPRLWKLAK